MKLKHTLLAAALIGASAFAFAAPASAADNCKAEITGNDLMQYDKKELKFDAGCATIEIIELGPKFVFRTWADRVAHLTLLEYIRTLFNILGYRGPRKRGNQCGSRGKLFHKCVSI